MRDIRLSMLYWVSRNGGEQMNDLGIQGSVNEPNFSKSDLQTATLGMGCFWSPDALLVNCRASFEHVSDMQADSAEPTYRQMGDHTETLQIDFDPQIINFEQLLDVFWNNHNPTNINDYKGRQYRSLLLYWDKKQQDSIQQVLEKREMQGKGRPETEIAPYSEFHLAQINIKNICSRGTRMQLKS